MNWLHYSNSTKIMTMTKLEFKVGGKYTLRDVPDLEYAEIVNIRSNAIDLELKYNDSREESPLSLHPNGHFFMHAENEFDIVAEYRQNGLDDVNSPAHYTSGKFEVIDVIEDWALNFNRGNAIKYIARAGRKDASKETEDLQKAIWYLTREINRIGDTK